MCAYGHNTLLFRLRVTVSDELHPRSFITKITSYKRVRIARLMCGRELSTRAR